MKAQVVLEWHDLYLIECFLWMKFVWYDIKWDNLRGEFFILRVQKGIVLPLGKVLPRKKGIVLPLKCGKVLPHKHGKVLPHEYGNTIPHFLSWTIALYLMQLALEVVGRHFSLIDTWSRDYHSILSIRSIKDDFCHAHENLIRIESPLTCNNWIVLLIHKYYWRVFRWVNFWTVAGTWVWHYWRPIM